MIFKRKSRLVLALAAIFCATAAIAASAAAGQPGSEADPLVTKSYVDQQIAKITQSGGTGISSGTVDSQVVAQLQTDVGDLTKFIIDAMTEIESLKARISALENGYTVVEVKSGQKLLLSSGAEALLRSGKAVAIKGANGVLVDASAGVDLNNGANVPLQHLLISSRTDGRGIQIKSDNAFVLVRGAYSVQ